MPLCFVLSLWIGVNQEFLGKNDLMKKNRHEKRYFENNNKIIKLHPFKLNNENEWWNMTVFHNKSGFSSSICHRLLVHLNIFYTMYIYNYLPNGFNIEY